MNGFLGQLAALRAEIERMQAERQASTGLSGILIFAMNYGPPLLLWAVILFLPALPLAPLTVCSLLAGVNGVEGFGIRLFTLETQ